MHADSTVHRELTLMFTDIVGYSRLMGRDETLAIQMLGDYRKILLGHIAEHGGIFIEFAGDAVFARFDSAISAVNAAVAIQKHLHLFNQGRDKGLPVLQTRIGLHKGAVVLRDDNAVLGDDVNIAARLEPLAVADGICISKPVYDDIRTELREPIKPLGVQSLKNIEQKIRVYLIKPTGLGWRDHLHYFWRGCSKNINAYRYPLLVLLFALVAAGFYFIPRWLVPGYAANYVEIANFKNLMNATGESDYFSSGITEAVRSQLADMRDVYLVEADKGIHAPIRLEGSVQRIGDNVRIAYRILRRKGNVQIAGGKLDGPYQDIFVLQDRLVGEIARYLASEFKLQNFRPAPLKLTNDITAYDYYLQGMDYLSKPSSQENFDEAIQKFNEALVHDKDFALANAGICDAYRLKYQLTQSAAWIKNAESYCYKALQQESSSAKVYESLGILHREIGKYGDSIRFLQKAANISPENASIQLALASTYDLTHKANISEKIYLELLKKHKNNLRVYENYGYFLTRQGRYQDAVKIYNEALELVPENAVVLYNLGGVFIYLDLFNKAAEALNKSTKIEPNAGAYFNSGSMYYFSGDFEKAVEMYKEALRTQPDDAELLTSIADAYNFSSGEKELADAYYIKAQERALIDVKVNPSDIKNYLVLALSYSHVGNFQKANEMLSICDSLGAGDAFSFYVKLRVAVASRDETAYSADIHNLLSTGYSKKLILADPYFLVLKQKLF